MSIISLILNGNEDSQLPAIENAIKSRKQAIALMTLSSLNVGDPVRLSRTARPKYIQGLTGTVESVLDNAAMIRIASSLRARRFSGRTVRCPMSIIEKA